MFIGGCRQARKASSKSSLYDGAFDETVISFGFNRKNQD